jgi:hypothetical protein
MNKEKPIVGETRYRAETIAGKHIEYDEYEVIKITPKGMWLRPKWMYISKKDDTWRTFETRFVSPTKEEAFKKLVRRTRAWIGYAERNLERAEKRYRNLTDKESPPTELDLR